MYNIKVIERANLKVFLDSRFISVHGTRTIAKVSSLRIGSPEFGNVERDTIQEGSLSLSRAARYTR